MTDTSTSLSCARLAQFADRPQVIGGGCRAWAAYDSRRSDDPFNAEPIAMIPSNLGPRR